MQTDYCTRPADGEDFGKDVETRDAMNAEMGWPVGTAYRGILADKDGTLVDRLEGAWSYDFSRGAEEGLGLLGRYRLPVHVVSNQGIVGAGLSSLEDVERGFKKLVDDARDRFNVTMGYSFCPHDPAAGCLCRKPKATMLQDVVKGYGWWTHAYMIGDGHDDIQAGKAAGATSLLVETGIGRKYPHDKGPAPDGVFPDFSRAAEWIVEGIEGIWGDIDE